jgi:hypothetical protein
LFGDLNCGPLGPLGDDNIIILSDYDEEKEMHEEDTADAEAMPSSAVNSLAQPSPPLRSMMHLIGCQMIVMMVETRLVSLRLSCQKGCLQEVCTKEFKNNNGFALLHHKFFYKAEWGW